MRDPITPGLLREAIDGLLEAAEVRRNPRDPEEEGRRQSELIATTYKSTADRLQVIRRILERDQAVLRLAAAAPLRSAPSSQNPCQPAKPGCFGPKTAARIFPATP